MRYQKCQPLTAADALNGFGAGNGLTGLNASRICQTITAVDHFKNR